MYRYLANVKPSLEQTNLEVTSSLRARILTWGNLPWYWYQFNFSRTMKSLWLYTHLSCLTRNAGDCVWLISSTTCYTHRYLSEKIWWKWLHSTQVGTHGQALVLCLKQFTANYVLLLKYIVVNWLEVVVVASLSSYILPSYSIILFEYSSNATNESEWDSTTRTMFLSVDRLSLSDLTVLPKYRLHCIGTAIFFTPNYSENKSKHFHTAIHPAVIYWINYFFL